MKIPVWAALAALVLLTPAGALAGVSQVGTLPIQHPIAVAVDGARNLVYVTREGSTIAVVDGVNPDRVPTAIAGPSGGSLTGVAVDSGTNRVFAIDAAHDSVAVFDGATRQLAAQVALPAPPQAIAVNADTNRVYVAVTAPVGMGQTRVVVLSSAAPYSTIAVTPVWAGTARGIAVAARANLVYVSLDRQNTLDAVGIVDGVVNMPVPYPIPTIHVDGEAGGLAADSETGRLVVADRAADRVWMVGLNQLGYGNGLVFSVPGPDVPTAVTVDESTHRFYVAGAGSGLAGTGPFSVGGTMAVYGGDQAELPLEERVSLGRGTRALTFDPANGRVFTANAGGPAQGPLAGSEGSVSVVSKFEPRLHGFRFVNSFDHAVVNLPHVGQVDLGPTKFGLCGGMIFAALDDYLAGGAAPPDVMPPGPRTSLRAYLMQRQYDSLAQDNGAVILQFMAWMALPIHSNGLVPGLETLTAQEYVRKVHPKLLEGMPVLLGLVRASLDPLRKDFARVFDNHQVLAIGDFQDPATGQWVIEVYDPNAPNATSYVWIERRTETSDRAGASTIGDFRGFFAIPYSFRQPYWVR